MRFLTLALLCLVVGSPLAAYSDEPARVGIAQLQSPDAPEPPVVAPPLTPTVTTPEKPAPPATVDKPAVPFAIDVRDDRFPITTETVNGEPVRCVRLPVNEKLRLKASGATGKVTWRIHPPSQNFDSYELGHVADMTLPAGVNAVVIASTVSEDGQTAVVDTLLVVSTQGPQPPPVVVVPPVVDPSVPPAPPVVVTPPVDPDAKVTTVTYVYEKDETAIPSAVHAALNRLNRERGILATVFEQNTFDGDDQVPDQYAAALAAAKEKGLPCVVALAGNKVVRTAKDPTTEAEVMEAAK